jgi:hypothetical protein
MRKFFGPSGAVSRLIIASKVLEANILGDPTARAVDVYVPTGQDGRGLPLLVDLVGTTSSGLSHTNWMGFGENIPERLDRLIGERRMPPVVVAFPDCFTRIGGNQYINSAATGPWEDFLIDEMLPATCARMAEKDGIIWPLPINDCTAGPPVHAVELDVDIRAGWVEIATPGTFHIVDRARQPADPEVP